MARGIAGTGRPQLIREYLARHPNEAFSAREIAVGIGQGHAVDPVSATITQMAQRGEITRVGASSGRLHFCWPRGETRPDKRRDRSSTAAARKARAQAIAKATAAPTAPRRRGPAPPKPSPQRAKASPLGAAISRAARKATAAATPPAKRTPAPRTISTNFSAAPGTVDNSMDPRRAASARIAADIEAFEARGGRIERLGVTRIFHHLADNDDSE